MKSNGSFLKNDKLIIINNKYIENADYKDLKGTILHEVQHAIQHIENFEGGMSAKLSKKAYYNKLGEIEATDVEKRSDMDYRKLFETAPESSKVFPIHGILEEIHKNPNSQKSKKLLRNSDIAEIYNEIYNNGVEGEYDRAKINKKGTTKDISKNEDKILRRIGEWIDSLGDNRARKIFEELDNSSFSNTKYSISNIDNQGRKLSKQQQEYFKDSKVRDENGNLIVAHHGTDAYDKWMDNHKDKIIYDKDDGIIKKRVNGKWVQSPNAINSFSNENNTTNDSKSQIAPLP